MQYNLHSSLNWNTNSILVGKINNWLHAVIACAGSFCFSPESSQHHEQTWAQEMFARTLLQFLFRKAESWQNNDCTNIENAMGEFCLCSVRLFPSSWLFPPRRGGCVVGKSSEILFIYLFMFKCYIIIVPAWNFLPFLNISWCCCCWRPPRPSSKTFCLYMERNAVWLLALSVNNSVHLADISIISTCHSTKHVCVSLR